MNPIILFVPFLLAALGAAVVKTKKQVQNVSLLLTLVGGGLLLAYVLPFVLHLEEKQISYWWMVDSFSALIVALIAFVYTVSLIVAVRYIGHEYEEKIIDLHQYKLFFVLFQLFALCMIITVFTNNSLILWLALEGTTLFSTFLVGLYRKKTSIEAAWKYMILCSTGISLGLVGILLLGYGAHVGGVDGNNIFLLSSLMENAKLIPENIIKLAFVFLFVGFGTKVGLAPMHTWLPDAHSKAPSPISAIFSAVLLNVALYSILRFKFITDTAFSDAAWTNRLFLIFGFASVVLSALMMLIQTNYKRMLAYSSIEHMGLATFAFGLSPVGAAFAVMHMIGHTFAKSSLFFGAGEILIECKTTKIPNIKDMLARAKYTSSLFILGILFIVAMPPSVLFISEYGMFAQAMVYYPKTAMALLVALGIIAYAMLLLTITMLLAKKETDVAVSYKKERWNITHTVIVAEFAILLFLAYWLTTSHGMEIINAIVADFLFIK